MKTWWHDDLLLFYKVVCWFWGTGGSVQGCAGAGSVWAGWASCWSCWCGGAGEPGHSSRAHSSSPSLCRAQRPAWLWTAPVRTLGAPTHILVYTGPCAPCCSVLVYMHRNVLYWSIQVYTGLYTLLGISRFYWFILTLEVYTGSDKPYWFRMACTLHTVLHWLMVYSSSSSSSSL